MNYYGGGGGGGGYNCVSLGVDGLLVASGTKLHLANRLSSLLVIMSNCSSTGGVFAWSIIYQAENCVTLCFTDFRKNCAKCLVPMSLVSE